MRRARLERLDRGLGAGVTDRGDNCLLLFATASGVQRIAAMVFAQSTLAVCKALVPAWSLCFVPAQSYTNSLLAPQASARASHVSENTAAGFCLALQDS